MDEETHRQRVELPAWRDEWMQGDRTGTIIGGRGWRLKIRLDRSGRVVHEHVDNVKLL